MSTFITKRLAAGRSSPWGIADSVHEIRSISNPSIWVLQVETPSHGGFWVPDHLLPQMPVEAQLHAQDWSGSSQWYEEDCSWAYVALTFPELFPSEAQADAIRDAIRMVAWIASQQQQKGAVA